MGQSVCKEGCFAALASRELKAAPKPGQPSEPVACCGAKSCQGTRCCQAAASSCTAAEPAQCAPKGSCCAAANPVVPATSITSTAPTPSVTTAPAVAPAAPAAPAAGPALAPVYVTPAGTAVASSATAQPRAADPQSPTGLESQEGQPESSAPSGQGHRASPGRPGDCPGDCGPTRATGAASSCLSRSQASSDDGQPADLSWTPGSNGVVDISPDQDGSLLYRLAAAEAKVDEKAPTPVDGAQVTFDVEVFGPDGVSILCLRQLSVRGGSGNLCMPEELELTLPRLNKGQVAEVLCRRFGTLDALPEASEWQVLGSLLEKEVLLRLSAVSFEEFCVGTLPASDRLAYAQGRKEAGGCFFKRGRFDAALERYSLAAELLSYVDDLKDGALLREAKELRLICELNAAACLLKLAKWREAEMVCAVVLRQHPDNEKALFRRATALLEQGDGSRAETDLRRLLSINKENREAKLLLDKARRAGRGDAQERRVYAKMLG